MPSQKAAIAAGLLVVALVTFSAAGADREPGPDAAESRQAEPITPVPRPPAPDAKSRLGEALFGDPRLSHNDVRSCASCHHLGSNGAGNARLDTAPDGRKLRFNTPTVFDAALSFRQNWEGSPRTLEEQAERAIRDPDLMASTWDELLGKFRADSDLSARFVAAYARGPDREAVLDALAAFEQTLLTPDSRFDQWLRGDDNALTRDEREGYSLFKYVGCVSCHQGVNVGGNLFERTDVYHSLFNDRAMRMRVASLRNVAVTAPYLDDGSAATLEEAVDRMAKAQLGSRLTPEQLSKIVAFLKTLTGDYRGQALTAPP